MTDLAEKLETAKEGGKGLDVLVSVATGQTHSGPMAAYTTSLDAIDALTQELLPDYRIEVSEGFMFFRVFLNNEGPREGFKIASAKTEPLARCAALLRALAQEKPTDD